MRRSTASFRLGSWLAILVLALNALWPLVANARPADAQGLIEICTAQGLVSLPDGSQQPDPAAQHLQPHCPLCSTGTDKLAVVAPAVWVLPVATSMAAAPPPFLRQPPAGAPQSPPAQPRAPPVLL